MEEDNVFAVFNQIKDNDYVIIFDKPTKFYLIDGKLVNKDYGIEFDGVFNPNDFYNKVMLEFMEKFIREGLPNAKVYLRMEGGNVGK